MNKQLLEIAQKHFRIETLETRNSDSLDFINVAVWDIKAALEAAYKAGQASQPNNKKALN